MRSLEMKGMQGRATMVDDDDPNAVYDDPLEETTTEIKEKLLQLIR